MPASEPNLEILATAIMLLDERRRVRYMNPAAENLFGVSRQHAQNQSINVVLRQCTDLERPLEEALKEGASFTEHHVVIESLAHSLTLSVTISPLENQPGSVVLEFHPAGGSVRIARDEQAMAQAQAVQMLLRQLAHEIRNPLGGIRGAAQLLEAELNGAELSEYTQVIIQEVNRLQGLLDRWLTPAKRPEIRRVNIHEVLERVRSLLLAEFPKLDIRRQYDISIPELSGDMEQLIQAALNIGRNAAQALNGAGVITLRTSVARQVTLAMKRWKLAARVDIIDNGPGIPEDMQNKVFFPLVSGREGGSVIHMVSEPGFTCFTIYLPIQGPESRQHGSAKKPLGTGEA
jgi:two-component system, NtrC family, nitrogen regulation sensor histidine kinase GlnL